MASPVRRTQYALGAIFFLHAQVLRIVHGLHEPDSGDISLQLSLTQSDRGPCMRLTAQFTTDVLDVASENSDHEILFDIPIAEIKAAEVVRAAKCRQKLPKHLINSSENFRELYRLDMLDHLKVALFQPIKAIHDPVNGFVRAYNRAKPAQRDVLWQLGHLLYVKEFIFFARSEGSMLHKLLGNMDQFRMRHMNTQDALTATELL